MTRYSYIGLRVKNRIIGQTREKNSHMKGQLIFDEPPETVQ